MENLLVLLKTTAPLSRAGIILLSEKILAIALLQQTLEFFVLRPVFADHGVWRWKDLREDFQGSPGWVRSFADSLFGYTNFNLILLVRASAATLLLFNSHPMLLTVLLVSTFIVLLRWRGNFNGGSDHMTLIVLLCVTLIRSFPQYPQLALGAVWYMALQTCISFFKAGLIKLRRYNWRSGLALKTFLQTSLYQDSAWLTRIGGSVKWMAFVSWAVMIFELTFPLALWNRGWALFYISAAVIFQLGNAYIFGLNRFVLAWAAAYPAVYYCSAG